MIINGKNITGLFIYDKDATYERNDMVVDGTTIYVCSPIGSDSVKGEKPENSDNFYIYLHDRFETTEGYLESAESGNLDVKAVSVNTLKAILNHYMTGFDSKGVIGDCIIYDKGKYTVKIDGKERSNVNYNSILSDIMVGDDINNGILKISGNLPELAVYGMSDICILRQYTTYNKNDRIRIQEIIDPTSGLIYVRSNKKSDNIAPGSFKCSVAKSYRIKEQIDKILDTYSIRMSYMNTLEESLKKNFRFRNLDLQNPGNQTEYLDLGNSKIVTLLLIKEDKISGFYKTDNITIDLFYKKSGETPTYYIFGGENTITVIENSKNPGEFSFKTQKEVTISNITYREYYGN